MTAASIATGCVPTKSYVCARCNVVLISADTLRADHVGTYGYARDTTPTMDQLTQKAAVFTDVTAQAPWTLSSHMSILTSLYSSRHGVLDRLDKLSDSTITLPDVLHTAGYTTGAFTAGGWVGPAHNYHTFDVFDATGFRNARNFEAMLAWLRQQSDRPFFLLWHDFSAHCPYEPPEDFDLFIDREYSGMVDADPKRPSEVCVGIEKQKKASCNIKCAGYYSAILPRLGRRDLDYIRAKYDGEIRQLDHRVSQILKVLEEMGIFGETIVILTSDHGESFAERENRKVIGHHHMYEEVLRVPLIMHLPGYPPTRIGDSVESIDIMPTVLEALGLPIPDGLDGRSLLPGLKAMDEERRPDPVYSEHFVGDREEFSVRYGEYKMIYFKHERVTECYDLARDPKEHVNICGRMPSMEKVMRRLLAERSSVDSIPVGVAELDEETRQELEALGYFDSEPPIQER